MDWQGSRHLSAVATIADGVGDMIFVCTSGLSVPQNPGLTVFEDYQITVTGAAGKYQTLIGLTLIGEGFISDLSMDPPGGTIHSKGYLV